jgi:hypothetical protein
VKGAGNSYDFGARVYDSRIGRWWSVDIKFFKRPDITPYRFCYNNPILFKDPSGNFESDGHFWTIYLIGIQLGIPEARLIAYLAEFPDTRIPWTNSIAIERYTWASTNHQQETHSLTGGDGPSESYFTLDRILNGNFVKNNILTADKDKRLEFGRLLHRFGDTFAHRVLGGNGELYGNEGFTLDHAVSDGSKPDKIGNRVKDGLYMEYVQSTASILSELFSKDINNVDFSLFEELANYSKNNNNASLHGILAYHVARTEGKSDFFINNVKGMNYSESDFNAIVKSTKTYLIRKNILFSVDYKYNEKDELQGAEFHFVKTKETEND